MACFRYIVVNTLHKSDNWDSTTTNNNNVDLKKNVKSCTIHFDCVYYRNLTESLFHDIFFVNI